MIFQIDEEFKEKMFMKFQNIFNKQPQYETTKITLMEQTLKITTAYHETLFQHNTKPYQADV